LHLILIAFVNLQSLGKQTAINDTLSPHLLVCPQLSTQLAVEF